MLEQFRNQEPLKHGRLCWLLAGLVHIRQAGAYKAMLPPVTGYDYLPLMPKSSGWANHIHAPSSC